MENKIQVIINEQNIAQENAKQLIAAFGAPFMEAGDILSTYKEIEVTDETQKDLMAEARSKRLTLKKIRTTVENKRKELKEDSLRTGKAIDGVAKYIRDNIQPAEEYLELQEQFAEHKEQQRRTVLVAERKEKLEPLTDNIFAYNLGDMTDDDFEKLYTELKSAHDLKLAQEKAYADQLEKERLEKEADDKRIREENEKLRLENENLIIEQRKKDEIAAAILKVNQEAAAKAEKEKAAENEALAKQLAAPDKDKISHFNELVGALRDSIPAVKTKEAQDITQLIGEMITKMQTLIAEKVEKL